MHLLLCVLLSFILSFSTPSAASAFGSDSVSPGYNTSKPSGNTNINNAVQKQEPQFYKDSYPSKYFLTNLGYVTPAKLQSPWGSCWAFAIASSLESSILKASEKIYKTSQYLEEIESDNGLLPDALPDYADNNSQELLPERHISPVLDELPESIDLSERAIAWFSHETQTDKSAGSQSGEGYSRVDTGNLLTQLGSGNFEMIESQLLAGQGIIAESVCPYHYNGYDAESAKSGLMPLWYDLGGVSGDSNDARTKDWSVNDGLREDLSIDWRVDEMYKLPSPAIQKSIPNTGELAYIGYDEAGTRAIKGALIDIGAVAISLFMDDYLPSDVISRQHDVAPSKYFTFTNWCQYDASANIMPNHAVTIVGWDDSYPASNFLGTESGAPPQDGAWLCKNNWGSDDLYEAQGVAEDSTHWGLPDLKGSSSGFFWLSYYDHSIGDPTVFAVEPASESISTIYQYDYFGASEYKTPNAYKSEVWVANSFTAQSTELLKSVSAQTFDQNQSVDIEIYLVPLNTDTTNMDANKLMGTSQRIYKGSFTFDNAGFHKVELISPILIEQGQIFIVAESISGVQDSDSGSYNATYLNMEMAFINTTDIVDDGLIANVLANPGESYIAIKGKDDADRLWYAVDEFERMYNNQVSPWQAVNFGNALIKAYSDPTSMQLSNQVYKTVELVKSQ